MVPAPIVEFFKKYDFSFIVLMIAIFTMGIFNLYSATHTMNSGYLSNLYKTQLLYFALALFAGIGVSFIQPKTYARYSYLFYLFNIGLLVLVLFLGDKGMGAQRWIAVGSFRFQPSEIMKLSMVFALARWFSKKSPDQELDLKGLIIPFIMTMIPTVLIVAEPDLGTGLLVLLIFFIIAFYRRLKWRSIAIICLIGVLSGGLMYKFGLKDYQKRRVSTFLNPGADARGSGYNAIQSKIAIGSGKFLGKGFKKSSQASLNYLPENHTDFVFSVFNEEQGFIGSMFLISLYLIFFYKFIWLASSVTRMYDSIVVIGLMGIYFLHTFINMGMVTGLMPIVGLPLPLMSYGGSSLITFGLITGVVTSISNSRKLF